MTVRKIVSPTTDENPPPAPPASLDRYQGAILGCALGDAVGAWAERRPVKEARYFSENILRNYAFSDLGTHHHGMVFGQYTDDTQLSRELIISILEEKTFIPETFARRLSLLFKNDLVVGGGRATQQAAFRLLQGVPWTESGTPPPSAGNGAAMRTFPIGLLYYYDVDLCTQAAQEQSIITHKAPVAVAAATAVALGTAMCLSSSQTTTGPHEPGWWRWLSHHLKQKHPEFSEDILFLSTFVFDGRKKNTFQKDSVEEFEAVRSFVLSKDNSGWEGVSPYAWSSTLWSFYCVMTFPFNIWKAIELAVKVGGDSDTIAAMAATMVGANIGVEKFPDRLLEEVAPQVHDIKNPNYDWKYLSQLAVDLHKLVEANYLTRVSLWERNRNKVIPLRPKE